MRTALLASALALASTSVAATVPDTPKHRVTDTYYGTKLADDYRWLENWDDPKVQSWSDAENLVTRAYLDGLPSREPVLHRIDQLTKTLGPSYYSIEERAGVYFAMKNDPPKQQPLLVKRTSLGVDGVETVIVDPNAIDTEGGVAIDFFEPSPDGSHVAVSMSEHGSESGTVYVYDAATGTRADDVVPGVNGGTAGGSVAWIAGGGGFLRTRYPQKGERPEAELPFYQQVYSHTLGTLATSDAYVVGKDFPKIAEIQLSSSDDARFTLINVFNGDGGEHAFFLRGPDGAVHRITRFADDIVQAGFGGNALYLLSRKNALNGKILRVPLTTPTLGAARLVVPTSATAIQTFLATPNALFVQDVVGGPSRVRVFDTSGRLRGLVPLPSVCAVNGMARGTGSDVFIATETFTDPGGWYRYDAAANTLSPTALMEHSPADFSDIEVHRVFARSKDGTRVPMSILYRKGTKLDGTAPTILTGYGGYGLIQAPGFRPRNRVWFDQGGVWAQANIRGGGEYGERWHRAGNLTHKQNVFDDFIACAEFLVQNRYTSRGRLAIEGGSNGGLLMGAVMTQRPDLFRAVVSHVGIYDMLRVELSPNGEFNTTEFGTVKIPAQYRALRAYSPYHHVTNGVKYPATMFTTGANDPRVDPMNSRKMTARLQATGSSGPVYLRTNSKVGHGVGSPLSARNEQAADVFSFMLDQLGVPYQEPPSTTVP